MNVNVNWRVGALAVAALLVGSSTASAAQIIGSLGFGGPGVLTFSTSGGAGGGNYIDFCPTDPTSPAGGEDCGVAANGTGSLTVDSQTGDFAALYSLGQTGTIKDLTDNPTDATNGNFTYLPIGPVAPPVVDFVDFTGDALTYTITEVQPAVCPTVPGFLQCTGYFTLTQTGDGVSVAMATRGLVSGGGFDATPYSLILSTQFSDITIAEVIAQASSPGGIFSNSWSGQLETQPIPEPGTIGSLAIGLGCIAFRYMRRRGQA